MIIAWKAQKSNEAAHNDYDKTTLLHKNEKTFYRSSELIKSGKILVTATWVSLILHF